MLKAEAQWIGRVLRQTDASQLTPLLNVGSSTREFREKVQPWIDREIFTPLQARGIAVHHLDIQEDAGVDLRGDLTDDSFVAGLATRGYRALLCCNLLEHVPAPAAIAAKLERIVPPGSYLVITVPNRFPWHPDPIDTMFRPSPEELGKIFPSCRIVRAEVLPCGTGWDYVERNPFKLITKVCRRIAGRKDYGGMKGTTSFLPWLFRGFRQTCLLLQKDEVLAGSTESTTPAESR